MGLIKKGDSLFVPTLIPLQKKEGKEENIVSANEEGKEEAKWQWEGDLNATIQNVWEDQVLIHS